MRRRAGAGAVCLTLLATALAGCGGPAAVRFEPGSTMYRLHTAGRLVVGVKSDQPGIGFRNPATGRYSGVDIRLAERVADALGLDRHAITYVETVSQDREAYLRGGRVDIVIASYSITPARRRVVGQAGPYYLTGQQLLVRERDKHRITGPDRLGGGAVCTARSSTSAKNITDRAEVTPRTFPTYTDCVRELLVQHVDAVTTDGAILLGYAAQQPDKLAVVGPAFTVEKYGIGYPKGDLAFCRFLTGVITEMLSDGGWDDAFADYLGPAGVPAPDKPTPEPCQA